MFNNMRFFVAYSCRVNHVSCGLTMTKKRLDCNFQKNVKRKSE